MTFNRSEQIAVLALTAALLVGSVVTAIDTWWPEEIEDFAVIKGAIPVPGPMVETIASREHAPPAKEVGTESRMTPPAADPGVATVGRLDINTASAKALEALPRIGPRTAAAIVAFREKNGPFERTEDLMSVRGVGPKTFDGLKQRITAEQP